MLDCEVTKSPVRPRRSCLDCMVDSCLTIVALNDFDYCAHRVFEIVPLGFNGFFVPIEELTNQGPGFPTAYELPARSVKAGSMAIADEIITNCRCEWLEAGTTADARKSKP